MLIACWGVPGRSYPDNGNRCLAAAVEIHASLQVRDMKTSMGITTGHVSSVDACHTLVRARNGARLAPIWMHVGRRLFSVL